MTLGPAQTPQRNVSLGSLYSSISTQQCCNSMSSCPSDHNKEVDLERRMKVDPPLVYHRNIQTWLAFVSGHFLVSSAIFTVRISLVGEEKNIKNKFCLWQYFFALCACVGSSLQSQYLSFGWDRILAVHDAHFVCAAVIWYIPSWSEGFFEPWSINSKKKKYYKNCQTALSLAWPGMPGGPAGRSQSLSVYQIDSIPVCSSISGLV